MQTKQTRTIAEQLAEAEARAAGTRRFLDRIQARIASRMLADGSAFGALGRTAPLHRILALVAAKRWESGIANTLECEAWEVEDLRGRLAA